MVAHIKELNSNEQRFFEALANGMPISEAATFAGFSEEIARGKVSSVRFVLPANDSQADDFLALIDEFEMEEPGSILPIKKRRKNKQEMLDEISAALSTNELRSLAKSLLCLADCVDQDWDPKNLEASYRWPSRAARIERNSLTLAHKAQKILKSRHRREKFLPNELLGEPAWDMLLELFCQFSGGAAISTKSLVISSGQPLTTGIRYIDSLEEAGLVSRSNCKKDKRVKFVALTKEGVIAVGRALESYLFDQK